MALSDRRNDMSPEELLEELELRFPMEMTKMERLHPDAWEALMEGSNSSVPDEEMDDLLDDLRSLLKI